MGLYAVDYEVFAGVFGVRSLESGPVFGRTVVLGLCILAAVIPDAGLLARAPERVAAAPAPAATQPEVAAGNGSPTLAPVANLSPVRLLIPKIAVNARIESRGLDANRNMETPKDFHDVAWYNLGPTPGVPGNALLNGHVNWWTGSAVFTRLAELRPGDMVVVVRGDGTRATFKVTSRRIVAANARIASLFAPSRVATLTLITCTGAWDVRMQSDTHRLLVSAVLV
jgi:LPXTG-site transpeptidase (sortase) family protein